MSGAVTARFRALDGWRGICALMVAAHHLEARGYLYGLAPVRQAWLFVDFFFVLSGFVIAHAYGESLQTPPQIGDFVLRRIGRLWPLHVAMLLCLIILELLRVVMEHWIPSGNAWPPFTGMSEPWAILTNLALVQSFGLHPGLTWNGPAWSIGTEFYTYLVFALVCWAVPAPRIARAARIAIVVLGAAVLARDAPLGMQETTSWGEFRCLFGFFTGTLAYDAWRAGLWKGWRGTACEIAATALALVLLLLAARDVRFAFAAPPVFALVVLVFAREEGALSRVLTTRGPQALGLWSYSIYMVHIFLVALLFSFFQTLDVVAGLHLLVPLNGGSVIDLGAHLANDLVMILFLCAVVAVSAVTYRLVERPGQRFFARLGTRATVRRDAAAA